MNSIQTKAILTASLLLALVSGCGGGAESGDTNNPAPQGNNSPAPLAQMNWDQGNWDENNWQ